MHEEDVEPQDEMDAALDAAIETSEQEDPADQQEPDDSAIGDEPQSHPKTMIPLSALQKQRTKTKEMELENQWLKQQLQQQRQPAKEPEDDYSKHEAATKGEVDTSLNNVAFETKREIREELWSEQNQEKKDFVDENLTEFLKQRPNLAQAIKSSPNRYSEAYELMTKLSNNYPTQKAPAQKAAAPAKRVSPNSPASLPKSAQMSSDVDVMGMSDKDFQAWRDSKRKRR